MAKVPDSFALSPSPSRSLSSRHDLEEVDSDHQRKRPRLSEQTESRPSSQPVTSPTAVSTGSSSNEATSPYFGPASGKTDISSQGDKPDTPAHRSEDDFSVDKFPFRGTHVLPLRAAEAFRDIVRDRPEKVSRYDISKFLDWLFDVLSPGGAMNLDVFTRHSRFWDTVMMTLVHLINANMLISADRRQQDRDLNVFRALGRYARLVLVHEENELEEHERRRDSVAGGRGPACRLRNTGVIFVVARWLQKSSSTEDSELTDCAREVIRHIVQDVATTTSFFKLLDTLLRTPQAIENGGFCAWYYLALLNQLFFHNAAPTIGRSGGGAIFGSLAEVFIASHESFIRALFNHECGMMESALVKGIAEELWTLLHSLCLVTNVVDRKKEGPLARLLINLGIFDTTRWNISPSMTSWNQAVRIYITTAWICRCGIMALAQDNHQAGIAFFHVAFSPFMQTLGDDKAACGELSRFLHGCKYFQILYRSGVPIPKTLKAAPFTNFVLKWVVLSNDDIDTMFDCMHHTDSEQVRIHLLELFQRRFRSAFNLSEATHLLSKFSDVDASRIWLPSFSLIEVVLAKSKHKLDNAGRQVVYSQAAEALATMLPKVLESSEPEKSHTYASNLLVHFDTATSAPCRLETLQEIYVVQLALLSETDLTASFAPALLLLRLSNRITDNFPQDLDPQCVCDTVLGALKSFCTDHRRQQQGDAYWALETHLVLLLSQYSALVRASMPVDLDPGAIWQNITGAGLDLEMQPIALKIWLSASNIDEEVNSLLFQAIDQHIHTLDDRHPNTILLQLLDYLMRKMTTSTFPILLKLVDKLTRMSIKHAVPAVCHEIRNLLTHLVLRDDSLKRSITRQQQAQQLVVDICLEATAESILIAVQFLTELLRDSLSLHQKAEADSIDLQLKLPYFLMCTKDTPNTQSIVLKIIEHPLKTQYLCWLLDSSATVNDVSKKLCNVLNHERVRLYTQGVEIPLQSHGQRAILDLVSEPEQRFIVTPARETQTGPPNEMIPSPRTPIEQMILTRYWTLYDLLYESGRRGQPPLDLLNLLNCPDEQDGTVLAYIERSLGPRYPNTIWKTRYAITSMVRTYDLQDVHDQRFCKHMISLLGLIMQDLAVEETLEGQETFAAACMAISTILPGILSEDDCQSCLSESGIFKSLEQNIELLTASEPHRRFVDQKRDCFSAALRCLLEVVASNEGSLREYFDCRELHQKLGHWLAGGVLRDIVVDVLGHFCNAPCPIVSFRFSILTARQISVLQRLQSHIWQLLKVEVVRVVEAGVFTKHERDLFFVARQSLTTVSTLDSNLDRWEGFDRLLATGITKAATRENSLQADSILIAHLYAILKLCGQASRRHGKLLSLDSQTRLDLQSILFDHTPTWSAASEDFQTLEVGDCRMDAVLCLVELTQHCDPANDFVINLRQILSDFRMTDDYHYRGHAKTVRPLDGIGGLRNLGQTCYLNSTLQQLFMNIDFRTFLINSTIEDNAGGSKQGVLKAFQEVFEALQSSCRTSNDPSILATALQLNTCVQEDAQQFFTMMMSTLEDNMTCDADKKALYAFFKGKNRTQTKGDCGHVSHTTDEYVNLCLTVKDRRTLKDSLDEYVQGERLDECNKFECTACKAAGLPGLVTAVRRTRLEHIPDNLVLGLKRFEYDMAGGATKINDTFSYPAVIDMGPYKIDPHTDDTAGLPPDMFELVGVIVHQGTLDIGHYWSYVKDHKTYGQHDGRWFRVEDHQVTAVDLDFVICETSGSPFETPRGLVERADSAYMLFYRRLPSPAASLPGAAHSQTLSHPTKEVDRDNRHVRLETQLFDLSTEFYVRQLTAKPEAKGKETGVWRDYTALVLEVACMYLMKIALHQKDPSMAQRLCEGIEDIVDGRSSLAQKLVGTAFDDRVLDFWIFSSNSEACLKANRLVIKMLEIIKNDKDLASDFGVAQNLRAQERSDSEDTIASTAVKALVLRFERLMMHKGSWRAFFDFLQLFAQLGPYESMLLAQCEVPRLLITAMYAAAWPRVRMSQIEVSETGWNERRCWEHLINFLTFIVTTVPDWANGYATLKDQDVWSSRKSLHLRLTSSQRSLLSTRDSDNNLKVVVAACRLCPMDEKVDKRKWPATKLLVALCDGHADNDIANLVVKTLCVKIRGESEHESYLRYLMVITGICSSKFVLEELKLQALSAALISVEEHAALASSSIGFIDEVFDRLPSRALSTIIEWMAMVYEFSEDEEPRTEMGAFITKRLLDFPALDHSGSEDETLLSTFGNVESAVMFLEKAREVCQPLALIGKKRVQRANRLIQLLDRGITAIRTHFPFMEGHLAGSRAETMLNMVGFDPDKVQQEIVKMRHWADRLDSLDRELKNLRRALGERRRMLTAAGAIVRGNLTRKMNWRPRTTSTEPRSESPVSLKAEISAASSGDDDDSDDNASDRIAMDSDDGGAAVVDDDEITSWNKIGTVRKAAVPGASRRGKWRYLLDDSDDYENDKVEEGEGAEHIDTTEVTDDVDPSFLFDE